MYLRPGWGLEDDGMVYNTRRITQTISEAVGQIIGLAIILGLAICLLLLMPGVTLISWINDLSGGQFSMPQLWLGSLVASLTLYGFIRLLLKDPDRSWKVYGGICVSVLILCITLSAGFQYHFGQRWARRLIGTSASKVRTGSQSIIH